MDKTNTAKLPVYIGIFLPQSAHLWVLDQINELGLLPKPSAYGVVACDHVTLAFRPSFEKCRLVRPGDQVKIAITAVCWNSTIMAARVRTLMDCDNDVPHITIAHHPETPPKNSNILFEGNNHQLAFEYPLYITGVLDFFPRTVDNEGKPLEPAVIPVPKE